MSAARSAAGVVAPGPAASCNVQLDVPDPENLPVPRKPVRRVRHHGPVSTLTPPFVGPAFITRAFDRAAARYDLMVALNPGYHRHLHAAARALIDALPVPYPPGRPARLVDLGCGSGASTTALLHEFGTLQTETGHRVELLGLDASGGMLDRARRKS